MKYILIPATGSFTVEITHEDTENFYAEKPGLLSFSIIPKTIVEPYVSGSVHPLTLKYLRHIPDGVVSSDKVHLIKWVSNTSYNNWTKYPSNTSENK